MFCPKCGKQIHDEAVVCIGCGCQVPGKTTIPENTDNKPQKESNSTANCALIFAFLIPIVGLIMGIIGCVKYKTPAYKTRCTIAIVVSVIVWIVSSVISSAILMSFM